MVHYSYKPKVQCARTKQDNVKVHYKKTYEAARALLGMKIQRARKFLHNVLNRRECVPVKVHTGGPSRHKQATFWRTSQGIWPKKSCLILLKLLQNVEANAKKKNLKGDLIVKHIEVLKAPKTRRRTFRAHGRINPYMYSPCHIQIIVEEKRRKLKTKQPPPKKEKKKLRKEKDELQKITEGKQKEDEIEEIASDGESSDDEMPDLEPAPQ